MRQPAGATSRELAPPAFAPLPTVAAEGNELVFGGTGAHALLAVETAGSRTFVFDDRDRVEGAAPATLVVWDAPSQEDRLDLRDLETSFTFRARVSL